MQHPAHSTHFFTNEKGNSLLDKFKGVFEHRRVHFFDALVGFFRASGYFKLRAELGHVSEIRILVGIDVDKLTAKYAAKGSEIKFVADDAREDFIKTAIDDVQKADYRKEVEDGMRQFLQDMADGKLQIRAHPSQRIHAKVYIFREKTKHDHGYGTVITGSSNLTEPGLEGNFEFNVELRGDGDIQFALEKFNMLWGESIEILSVQADEIRRKTYIVDNFTPFEIYIKLLTEYFGDAIDFNADDETDLPSKYKRLTYQVEAVNEGFEKLKKHGGFFLSDVVGLGKTVIAVRIARRFAFLNGRHTRILVVCPPALLKGWEETCDDFNLGNSVTFISNGSLHKVEQKAAEFDLIIVDEAHKFRSDTSEGFEFLQRICKTRCKRPGNLIDKDSLSKKVILVSATPLNNKPEDLRNLVYLFQDSKTEATLEIGPIQSFFAPLIDRYRKLRLEKDHDKIKAEVKDIYESIRHKIVQPLTVRRTRTDIDETPDYKQDLVAQGIRFPDLNAPHKILYQLDTELESLYDETLVLLTDNQTGLMYARYQAISNLKVSPFEKADLISELLAKIMKTLLLKRLDSSFTAFRSTIDHFRSGNSAMIKMFEDEKVYIAPALKGKVTEYILEGREDELEKLILEKMEAGENVHIFRPEDFKEGFLESLKHDQDIYDGLAQRWGAVKKDPKLDEFIEKLIPDFLRKKNNPEQKLVVFSEAAVTTKYLFEALKKTGRTDVLMVTSDNRKESMPIVRENFDANFTGAHKNDFNILISTEVLAEGVNLHRSNTVVNYDTPWNATRLMQRIGRVNRIGSTAGEIHVFNFFPTAKVDKDIDLKKRALIKLQAFHTALGEDSQIFSREEEVGTFGLFERLPDEEERNERLRFLTELRDFRKDNYEEFKRIKALPKRARTGRKEGERTGATIAFLKNRKRDSFYLMRDDVPLEELTFVEAAKIFKAVAEENSFPLHAHHHDHIGVAVEHFKTENIQVKVAEKSVGGKKMGATEQGAIGYLRQFNNAPFLSELERELILFAREMVQIGRFQPLVTAINRFRKKAEKERTKPAVAVDALVKIIEPFWKTQAGDPFSEPSQPVEPVDEKSLAGEPKIILSESFVA